MVFGCAQVAASVQARSLDTLCLSHPLWKEAAAMMANARSKPKDSSGSWSQEALELMAAAALLEERAKGTCWVCTTSARSLDHSRVKPDDLPHWNAGGLYRRVNETYSIHSQ